MGSKRLACMPDWLPSLLSLNGVSLQADYDELFAVYKRDFIDSSCVVVEGDAVFCNTVTDKSFGNGVYTHGFTHLITKGKKDRFIDYNRARKLPWVRAVLENYQEPEVTAFYVDAPSGEQILYLWLADFDFVVILKRFVSKKEKSASKMIVTAYHLEPYGKKDMLNRYGRSSRQL